jgi:hypothetical protein
MRICNNKKLGEAMTLPEVKAYFKTWYQITRQTKISRSAIYAWRKRGYIDIKMQLRIEEFTQGKLKASLDHIGRNTYAENDIDKKYI